MKEIQKQPLPEKWRVADEDYLMEPAQVHGPPQHPHILLAVGGIQSSDRFVPEQGFRNECLPPTACCGWRCQG